MVWIWMVILAAFIASFVGGIVNSVTAALVTFGIDLCILSGCKQMTKNWF